ncbi:MAG: sugar transferase, partial [Solirubrobacterales bacterium]
MLRRAFDLLAAAAGLVIASPLLLAAIVAIPLDSRGSPFYRQRRVGLDGHEFEVVKLRTMVSGAEGMGAADH